MSRLIQAFIDFISPDSITPQIGEIWEYHEITYAGNSRSCNSIITMEILWVDEHNVGVLPFNKDLVEYIPLEEFKLKAYKRVK